MFFFRLFASLLIVACFFLVPSSLPAQDHLVVFGGYSYLRPPVTADEMFVCTAPACPLVVQPPTPLTTRQNLNGWELSATYRFLPFLGVAVDFSAHYGSAFSNSTSNVHQYTGLAGPEVSLPSGVSPFAHLLFGGTHQSVTSGVINGATPGLGYDAILPNTIHSFATVVGAGIDLKLVSHLWIRPIQIDYLLTRLNNGTQNQPRISAGLVLHF